MRGSTTGNDYQEHVSAFQLGDERALAFFYEQLLPTLALSAYKFTGDRLLSDEIASDAMVSTWKMRHKLDSFLAIRGYAYTCVRNASGRAVKTRKKQLRAEQLAEPTDWVSDTPYQHTIRSEVYRLIHTFLKHLPEATRTVLIMHYLQGKTTGQIARELNRAPSTIKTQKAAGLATLRSKIQWPAIILFSILLQTFFLFV